MEGWKTVKSKNFKTVKVLVTLGRVTAYATDFDDSKTNIYKRTYTEWETSEQRPEGVFFVADNFEYFSEEQKAELKDIVDEWINKICEHWNKEVLPKL